ncbi:hypothetical protein ACM46_08515 [Chryseobacterium angstadtii]|uniref:DUF4251 domain-containing protein n=1 Tax=Chryseobacterium angstadtii TaxID=558151 RepID=A0A0J7IEA1_9FLAO|nr:hypothetical protein [Chryseobacterium angstadtii]KMQ64324.1 hypothetical protein ACM46_08515 [Chryseobacterium angstadtii]
MKQITAVLFIILSFMISAQENKYSDKEFQQKLDSIKTEGNLLYSHESASWNSGDLMAANQKLREIAQSYLTYKSNDTIKTIFLNKDESLVVAEYSFKDNQKKPVKENFQPRKPNTTELNLNKIRSEVISQLSDPKYEVGVPEGYSLNIIVLPFNENYKVYLIPGTSQSGVIPFGNDFLFIADKDGKIISNKKFHSRLIPAFTQGENGITVTMTTHSHLNTNPFISATDICTFKLYAPLTKLEAFSVYSGALGTYMQYNYKKDSIEKVKRP